VRPPPDPALRERLRLLPKTELHLHALGAMRPLTVVALARRSKAPILAAAERGAAQGYEFAGLPEFIEFFLGLFGLVRTAADFEQVAFEALEDAARQGVRYAELRWTPTSHLARGADERAMFAGIAAGRRAAERAHGIVSRTIVDFPRSLPLSVAEEAVEIAIRNRASGVTALDVSGDEKAVAADPTFCGVFERARRAGLHATAHAGEGAGPESVVGAIDLYGAERIGHGTRCREDPRLVRRLARDGIPLEVCPTSNEALKVVRSVAEHPVRGYLEAGVPCVVSSDDPVLFGTDLVTEYERLHREAGVPFGTLARMAAEGFRHAFLEDGPEADHVRARLDAWRAEALAAAGDGARRR
jgi:adenosine deaminase